MAVKRSAKLKNPRTLAWEANVTEGVVRILRPDRTFVLREPIDLKVKDDAGHVVVSYRPLDLEGWGDDLVGALESFADQFAGMWDWIAQDSDRNLDAPARQLKRVLKSMVESVE
ncbi:MAG: hypothetical protein U0Q18_25250 [Bryobacteraceae bacterium]